MRSIITLLCSTMLAVCLGWALPDRAAAGGPEFPAGGARGMGRGSSNFARADDPTVMLRNPALLADLWSSMALAGANLMFADSCFAPTGTWGRPFGHDTEGYDPVDFGEGPIFFNPPRGATDLDGNSLPRIQEEPMPEVCYGGPVPVVPHIGLTMKLTSALGIGLGFFPPDSAALNQWGDRDGTVMTPNGRRPSPTRFFKAHQNNSYFSALGAVGYRVADWLRIGAGFQWALVAYSTTTFSRQTQKLSTRNDVRSEIFGRDLFIPGLIASVHVVPFDNLDIALGFKWSDNVQSIAKLDVTSGVFGSGEPYEYLDAAGNPQAAGTFIPHTSHNLRGEVLAPPIWVPQLSLGVRFADRLVPRVQGDKWASAQVAAGRSVQDSMETERWDIEANVIYYMNSVSEVRRFRTPLAEVPLDTVDENGNVSRTISQAGSCIQRDDHGNCQLSEIPALLHGKDHWSLRLGGDYNILPGLFAVRAGVSYETDGTEPRYLDVTSYMLGRTGLHVGATLRVAERTDLSIGYVHFIQKNVRLTPNLGSGAPLPPAWTEDPDRYNLVVGDSDGAAGFAIPDSVDPGEGPLYSNAGKFFYHLDVISIGLAQHF